MFRPSVLITLVVFSLPLVAQKKSDDEPSKSIIKGKPFLIMPGGSANLAGRMETSTYVSQLLELSKNDELRSLSEQSDTQGFTRQHLQQFHKGIKVEYGTVSVHSKNSKIENLAGEIYDIPSTLNSVASISEKSALQAAINYTGAKKYKWENTDEEAFLKSSQGPEASYYPVGELVFVKVYIPGGGRAENEMSLAYKFDIYAEHPLSRKYVYVDAQSGAVIHVNPIIKHVDGTAATKYSGARTISTSSSNTGNSYWLRDNTRSNGVETYNLNNGNSYSAATDFIDNDNNWTSAEFNNSKQDNAALDAHWGAMKTYDYFKEKFTRNSYDNQGTKIKSYVHYGSNYVNAFWNGQVMTYGDGNGSVGPLTSVDVCAHEIGHAVCSSTANLVYASESGALNESLSDIWGATIENYAAPEKSPWLLGEDFNFIIRSLANPNEHNQPDTYRGTFWDPNEEVHTNSGVMNHWYYILVEGKTGVDDNGAAYSVQGIGFEKAAKITYRMETVYLTSNARYADARTAAIQSAIDLFGASSNETQQTRKAWNAVGVYDTTSSPSGLTATASSNTRVSLSWIDHSTDETGFSVERSLSFNSGFTEIAKLGANTTSYSDLGITNTIYYYRVKATFTDYASSYSNVASVSLGSPPISMSNTSISTCATTFLDPSGLSDYANYQNITMRISPAEVGKKVKVSFSSFSLSSFDYLSIYDGDGTQNLIGSYTGTTVPTDINALNSTGTLTFVFYSDSYNTSAGWQANLTCVSLPTMPTNLTATAASATQVNLNWQDTPGETGFIVERRASDSPNSSFVRVATLSANTTSYSDQGLATNQRYIYRVMSLIGTTYSPYSNTANVSLGNPPLLMQNGTYEVCGSLFFDSGGSSGNYNNSESFVLRVNPSEVGKKLKVSFSSFSLESGYDYLSIYDGDNVSANLIGTYTGYSLPPEIIASNSSGTLTFVFRSDGSSTSSGWQASLACVVIPNAPSNLVATVASATQINLSWQDNATDETAMIIERRAWSSSSSTFSIVTTLPANSTSYSNQNLATDEKYYYRVRAANTAAYSAYSNIAEAIVGTLPLLMQSGTFQVCGSTFLDPGGAGDYGSYQYATMRINPSQAGQKVKISFSSFSLNTNDFLSVYDGDAYTENLIGTFTGTTLPPDINALNATGGLTFIFSSSYQPNAGWRATLSCQTIPNAPSALIATTASPTQINLAWQDNATSETGFVVERRAWSAPNSPFAKVATLAANIVSYADQALATDEKYFYRVRALTGTTYSPYSNTADATVGTAKIFMQSGTFQVCGATFLDPGGAGDYGSYQYTTMRINPSQAGQKVKISFSSFSLNTNDFLSVYDGDAYTENLIGKFTGTTLPPDINALNATGGLTFVFSSSYQPNAGWRATLSCQTIPNAPSALIATTASPTQINLAWQDNATGETGFVVERRAWSAPNSPFAKVATLAANIVSYTDQALATDEKYFYRVRALTGTTYSPYSNTADATVGTAKIFMQSGTFQVCGSTFLDPGGAGDYGSYQYTTMRINPSQAGQKVKISFSSFSLNTNDFLSVYDGDAYTENLIGKFTGTTLPPDINALNATGGLTFVFSSSYQPNAGWRATLSCQAIPNAPSALIATTTSPTQINLAWQDNATGETGFVVERRPESVPNSPFAKVATLAVNVVSYADQALATDEKYFYRVRALTGTTYSPYSNTVNATVGLPPLLMQSGTFQTCGITFLDPGGYGNYPGNYNYLVTRVNPFQNGKKIKVSFSSFNLNTSDFLSVYDGDAYPENLIGTFTGTTLPPDINALNTTGGLTFIFNSSSYASNLGWQATLSCVDIPNAPSNLIGTAASDTQINLNWQDNSTSETSVVVERKSWLPDSKFTRIATLPSNTTSYSDRSLPTNQRYQYRITALIGTAYSAFSNVVNIAIGNAPVIMGNGVVSTCNSQFFDSGYTGNYLDNENYTLTVTPGTSGGKMSVSFASLSLESCCDRLKIYDGPSTSSTLIGTYNGSSLPPVITATNAQGSLTFQFSSDGSAAYSGWQASLTCVLPPPVITFDNINMAFQELPFDLNASAYPGANFVYSIVNDPSNTGQVSLSGIGNKTVTLVKSGLIKLKAFLPAGNGYPNIEKVATLVTTKGNPRIVFDDLSLPLFSPSALNASAYVGAKFTYSVVADPSNTAQINLSGIDNKTITATGSGVIKIKASLAETSNFFSAEKTANLTFYIVGLEPQLEREIQIWPIPTERFITVKMGSIKFTGITLTNALGKQILDLAPKSDEFEIDLGNFSSGVYMLKFSTEGGEILRRILIVK